jgi:hypothetical protein
MEKRSHPAREVVMRMKNGSQLGEKGVLGSRESNLSSAKSGVITAD